MFARTTGPDAPPPPAPGSPHECAPDTGSADCASGQDDTRPIDADQSGEHEPTAALKSEPPCEALPAAAADFSDLLALADGCADDPLLQIGREPLPLEQGGLDSESLRVTEYPDETDPLSALTLEYRRALLSQRSDNAHQLKTTTAEGTGPVIRVSHDTFAELTSHSHPEASVVDLLTEGKTVDTLLESLDTFGAEQIFEANQTHEILALLAPHGLSARRPGPTAQLARAEHHMVSVDSYMPMPNSIEDEAPKIADEHDH
ncbi:TagK domain-containing protein [Paraburkholderia sp. MMS20-SJTR3]|uniref:TagK domain-containing protein n=1 Tax=Paraburkholderia sejongensis TaxID=2886946 RepID=A0ABS8K0N8_9BURK|nr:TagK domain-containing protein [Paraburkholderia sp. MMS20-SJTR3]MCC8395699.1 TagK domain-containing protein [Paraburkholderia sp. MMS20-SJTR3]